MAEEPIVITFPSDIYSLDVLKKAAYRLSAAFSFEFASDSGTTTVTLFPIAPLSPEELDAATHRFRTEVLDQDLRTSIAAETEGVRNAILAHAFSRTGLQNE